MPYWWREAIQTKRKEGRNLRRQLLREAKTMDNRRVTVEKKKKENKSAKKI